MLKKKVVSTENKIANIPKSSTFSLDVFDDKLVSQTDTKNLKNSLNYYIQIKDSKWHALL